MAKSLEATRKQKYDAVKQRIRNVEREGTEKRKE